MASSRPGWRIAIAIAAVAVGIASVTVAFTWWRVASWTGDLLDGMGADRLGHRRNESHPGQPDRDAARDRGVHVVRRRLRGARRSAGLDRGRADLGAPRRALPRDPDGSIRASRLALPARRRRGRLRRVARAVGVDERGAGDRRLARHGRCGGGRVHRVVGHASSIEASRARGFRPSGSGPRWPDSRSERSEPARSHPPPP